MATVTKALAIMVAIHSYFSQDSSYTMTSAIKAVAAKL
jgi:hypothetical protein